jgi:type IV secretion system protein VirB5
MKPMTEKNPYLAGREEWLERYGGYIKAAAQWRLIAVACLLIAALSITGNVIQATKEKVVPYIVTVDKLGTALAVSRADLASPVPRELIQAELANVVVNWRTVTADLDLQTRMIDRLSGFIQGSAKGVLTGWFEANNPHAQARAGKLVSVNIKGLPLPVSTDSWRVEWRESTRNQAGTLMDVTDYEATMKIAVTPPSTDAQIIKNPGGIYITELSYSTILNQTGAAAPEKE